MRCAHWAAVIAFCVMTQATLASSLAAGDFAFSPPSGWVKVAAVSNAKWIDRRGTEFVIFHPTSFQGSLSMFVAAILKKEKAAFPDQRVWNNKPYYICGAHPGRYVIWTTASHGRPAVWEQVMAIWGGDAYVVSYVRPHNHAPSAVARASLLSVCGVAAGGVESQWQAEDAAGAASAPSASGATATQAGQPASAPDQEPTPYVEPTILPRYAPFIPPR